MTVSATPGDFVIKINMVHRSTPPDIYLKNLALFAFKLRFARYEK